ncbi:MAG: hypothetical protein ACJAY7_001691 [Pseudohongiellaceae bacterium]|jgi:hypothetical protein
MNRFRNKLPVSNTVTSELISDNLSGFAFVLVQQPLKEPLCRLSVPTLLQEHINDFTVLINGSPQVMECSLNLHEHLMNEERVTITLMFLLNR